MTFVNDYKLSPEVTARVQCSTCGAPATTGQNNGSAPFWYHCDDCAEQGRRIGHFYSDTANAFQAEQLRTLEAKCGCGSHLYGIVRVHHCNEGKPKLKTYPATVGGKTVQVTIPED